MMMMIMMNVNKVTLILTKNATYSLEYRKIPS